nr:hypothetical protein OG999_11705 [Streptomyces sp. NBC_00886]
MDDFYGKQTVFSDPGDLDVGGLPHDPGELAWAVRDLITHRGEGRLFGHSVSEQRLRHDAKSRYVTEMLKILRERRDAPLTERREPGERFVGTCRDLALRRS